MKTKNDQQNNFKIDFIGVGAPKCGTTWVAKCLAEHPQICLSNPKEPHYFNKNKIEFTITKNANYNREFQWYKNHFNHCQGNKKIGEFSTHYLYDNEAPRLIAKFFPEVKIIICLRNPIDRLYSHFLHKKYKHPQRRLPEFEKILEQYPDFIKTGYYIKYIKNYLKYFQRKNIYIIIYEEMKNAPLKTIQELYSFLEVEKNFTPPSLDKNPNPTSLKTGKLKYEWTLFKNSLMNSRFKNKIIKILKKTKLNKLILKTIINPMDKLIKRINKNKKSYKPMKEKTRQYLKELYKPYNKELEKLLSIDLSSWNK